MKNLYLLILAFLSISLQTNAQTPLQFDTVGFDHSYCRLFNYQSGRGAVYASANGGTPGYIYQWTNLQNNTSSSNSTWAGLNPGDYQIIIWDAAGDSIYQTITVDSLNPIASIYVNQGDVTGTDPHFFGDAPASVTFSNQSLNFANPNNPNADTSFFWQMTQFDDWTVVHDLNDQQYTYDYGGDWGVTLVAINKNGCQDTSHVYLHLSGTGSIEEESNYYNLIAYPDNHEVTIYTNSNESNLIRIYDLNGKLIRTENITLGMNNISFLHTGLFIFEIRNANNELLESGKFKI